MYSMQLCSINSNESVLVNWFMNRLSLSQSQPQCPSYTYRANHNAHLGVRAHFLLHPRDRGWEMAHWLGGHGACPHPFAHPQIPSPFTGPEQLDGLSGPDCWSCPASKLFPTCPGQHPSSFVPTSSTQPLVSTFLARTLLPEPHWSLFIYFFVFLSKSFGNPPLHFGDIFVYSNRRRL